VRVRTGAPGAARFTPGNRHFVITLWDEDAGYRVTAIDLATAKQTEVALSASPDFALSPDGRSVLLWNDTLMIVPLDGATPTRLSVPGSPLAWLR
jgi:hypothetical protein